MKSYLTIVIVDDFTKGLCRLFVIDLAVYRILSIDSVVLLSYSIV